MKCSENQEVVKCLVWEHKVMTAICTEVLNNFDKGNSKSSYSIHRKAG